MPTPEAQNSAHSSLSARIRKSFPARERDFTLDVDFTAAPGFTILFGPSGSGKTTLLDCIAGLTLPDSGRIAVAERLFFDRNASKGKAGLDLQVPKRGVGYVFQDLALFPNLTVEQNTEYGLAHLPRPARKQRAITMLEAFRIDDLRHRRPAQISGGERQRVALARALVTDPCLLLLDEPLAALDAPTKSTILADLRRWNQAHGIPILYVTHSREEVLALGERVIVMDQGRIIAQGTPHEVLRAPVQETIAQLAGFENIFDAIVLSLHPDRGTSRCRLEGQNSGTLELETPLVRAEAGSRLRVGIRAGDILLAITAPTGLSARNIVPGRIVSLEQCDRIVSVQVHCGVEMEVHVTLAARDALNLMSAQKVWLVIKTHSCHIMQKQN